MLFVTGTENEWHDKCTVSDAQCECRRRCSTHRNEIQFPLALYGAYQKLIV
jgi:hypothetical protein